MNKSSMRMTVVVLLIVIVAALAVRLWTSHETTNIIGPLSLRMGTQENVYAIFGDKLYVHSRYGELVNDIPLSRFGMSRYIDDFWVFENGDILFRSLDDQNALKRCSMKDYSCAGLVYGENILQKSSILRMYVDEKRENLYISDNFGGEVLLLDLAGKLQRKSGKMFKFPNHLSMGDDGSLYVADTENHRIAAIRSERNDFGSFVREFAVNHTKPGKTYPVTLAQTQRGDWWVVAAGITMQHGSLMIFSREGAFVKEVDLPANADPYAILPLQGKVLVSDPSLMQIYELDLEGNRTGEFGSSEFTNTLLNLSIRRNQYDTAGKISLAVLIGGLVLALVIARSQRNTGAQKPTVEARDPLIHSQAPGTGASPVKKYDYHSLVGVIKILFYITGILMALLLILLFLTPAADQLPALFHFMILLATLVAIVTMQIVYSQMNNTSIEISDQGILFIRQKKKIFASWHEVREIKMIHQALFTVYTDNGKFPIGRVEPADNPGTTWYRSLAGINARYAEELIEDIKRRAPHVKTRRSLF